MTDTLAVVIGTDLLDVMVLEPEVLSVTVTGVAGPMGLQGPVGPAGAGGGSGGLTVVDNGDGTVTLTATGSSTVIDNGDGTVAITA